MIRFIDYYQTLGVSTDSETSVIREAFQAKVRWLDASANDLKDPAEALRNVNEAYRVLSNAQSRGIFDKLAALFKEGDLIPGASSAQGTGPFSSAQSVSAYIDRYVHSEFYNAFFAHLFANDQAEFDAVADVAHVQSTDDSILSNIVEGFVLLFEVISNWLSAQFTETRTYLKENQAAGYTLLAALIGISIYLLSGPSVKTLIERFETATPFEKVYLVEKIGSHGSRALLAKDLLLTTLQDEHEEIVVRGAVARALTNIAPEDSEVHTTLFAALTSPNPFLRANSAQALGSIETPSPSVIAALFQALRDDNLDVRLAASQSLAQFGPEALEASIASLSNANMKAAEEIHHAPLDTTASLPVLIEDLKDPEPAIRITALETIAATKVLPQSAVNDIIPLLNDPQAEVVVTAARTLGTLRDERSIWPLLETMADQDPIVQQAVATALSHMPADKVQIALASGIAPATPSLPSPKRQLEEVKPVDPFLAVAPIVELLQREPELPSLLPQSEMIETYPPLAELIQTRSIVATLQTLDARTTVPSIAPESVLLPEVPPQAAVPDLVATISPSPSLPKPGLFEENKTDYLDIQALLRNTKLPNTIEMPLLSLKTRTINRQLEVIPVKPQTEETAIIGPAEKEITVTSFVNRSWKESIVLARDLLGKKYSRAPIQQFLKHQDPKLRVVGATAAATRGYIEPNIEPLLFELLDDKSEHVRAAAAFAFAEISPKPTPALESKLGQLVRQKSFWVKMHAARALGRLDTPTAQELLKYEAP